ncbi:hypothetical protein [Bradyrhizobium sp. JYMT SZCCT0428]|uniref:hypothetical protein n=1 Tax=Bradyrhizobium sp. JYMT SZCCT0428 TaxID=2807673 RepID=UPI001BAB0A12|nr:hypothetical protein [Bradyrhizobium sp. JYMT SZCCT0428]MBR1156668.1 hypothetical protein [Bradyrhizobium sp. JYMT SZCCT0428]
MTAPALPFPIVHRRPRATRAARRQRDLVVGLIRDLGRQPNSAEMALIDQAAALILQRENLSAATLRGEPCDSQTLLRLTGAVTRSLASLRSKGGKRVGAASSSLNEYLARKAAHKTAGASDGGPA